MLPTVLGALAGLTIWIQGKKPFSFRTLHLLILFTSDGRLGD